MFYDRVINIQHHNFLYVFLETKHDNEVETLKYAGCH